MKLLKLAILCSTLLLASCEPAKEGPIRDDSGLPSSSFMEAEGTVRAPQQTKEFCSTHPEFEKC